MRVYDVRDYGATGSKDQNAQAAIQAAIDACESDGGGTVYLPPGQYTSGTLHLRSHMRFHLEAGATLYSSKDQAHYDRESLLFGEDLVNITVEGRGKLDGQSVYEWRLNDMQDWYILPNQRKMESLGKPLRRPFPASGSVGKLMLLIRCRDVLIQDLAFLDSPFWTMHLYGCERVIIDRLLIRTSRESGVWADGIDPDGCRDVRISNCTIDTGDDAIVFYSYDFHGPALPCENITVTNCRLSSAGSALKFCDGNKKYIRNVTVDNCVITDSNRGIAFMVFDGGYVSDVVISNLTVDCRRYDWFWWGNGDPIHFNVIQRSQIHPELASEDEPPPGLIRNVLIENVVARGTGPCSISGHRDSPLAGVTLKNVKMTMATDHEAPYEVEGPAMAFHHARNMRLDGIEIIWEEPVAPGWQGATSFENVELGKFDLCERRTTPPVT